MPTKKYFDARLNFIKKPGSGSFCFVDISQNLIDNRQIQKWLC